VAGPGFEHGLAAVGHGDGLHDGQAEPAAPAAGMVLARMVLARIVLARIVLARIVLARLVLALGGLTGRRAGAAVEPVEGLRRVLL
jgi:hypothetical protein